MSRIFINYRRQDSEGYVGRLYDALLRHFAPEDIFMDIDSIGPGVDFVAAIERAVAECDLMLAVIGPGWLSAADDRGEPRLSHWDDFVRLEIASALQQNKRVIPILVGAARMPGPADLPADLNALARRNAFELSHQRFAYDVERLITVLRDAVPLRPAAESGVSAPVAAPVAPDPAPPRPAPSPEKLARFKALRDALVNASDSPLYAVRTENRYYPVLGEGALDARIMFIGEAPGKTEAAQGVPFCGPSGEILADMLNTIHLRREDVFVTNLVLDYPGTKREPTPAEIAYYAPFVDQLIDLIQPAIIATLGRFAMMYIFRKLDLIEKRQTITELHGKLVKARMPYGEIHVVPLYHPAVVLYSATQKHILRQDFARLRLFL